MAERSVTVEGSVMIDAPRDVVCDALADEANFFELRPSAVEHRDITPLPNGGHACTQVYEVGRRRFEIQCRTTVVMLPERILNEYVADQYRGESLLVFERDGEGTRLSVAETVWFHGRAAWVKRLFARPIGRRELTASLGRMKRVAEAAAHQARTDDDEGASESP